VPKSDNTVYHVKPKSSSKRWLVCQENARFRCEFDTKAEAVRFAKRAAQRHKFGRVQIHERVAVRRLTMNLRRSVDVLFQKIRNFTFARRLSHES